MFLSFPRFLFTLTNALCRQNIMISLVFSFAAAQKAEKFLSEVKIPALIALNSTLLISWSSAASPDGCPELLKELQVGAELQPLVMLKIHWGHHFQELLCLVCSDCGNSRCYNTWILFCRSDKNNSQVHHDGKLRETHFQVWKNGFVAAMCGVSSGNNFMKLYFKYSLLSSHMGSPLLWVFPLPVSLCVTLVQKYFAFLTDLIFSNEK